MEVISDGRTVWVNANDGSCIARFSWFGIDIHRSAVEQLSGKGQCLECKLGPTTLDDWNRFQDSMAQFYGVRISQERMPIFLQKDSV